MPLHRVQTVGTTATVFQRRRRLATARIDTASGAPAAHDLDADDARALREAVTTGLLADRTRRRAERRARAAAAGDDPEGGWIWPAVRERGGSTDDCR